MKYAGIDLEVNLKGIWNVGLALFEGRHCRGKFNIFIKDNFSENLEAFAFGGNVESGRKYRKTITDLMNCHAPVWVATVAEADQLAATILKGWNFSRSFGYNSDKFDLEKLDGTMPKTLEILQAKPHIDLMPLAVVHLVGRKSYRKFWEAQVLMGNTHEGNPEYAKFGAELVLNYIAFIRAKKAGTDWVWKKEPHIGCEDLIGFEYPILHYFTRILKAAKPGPDVTTAFLKWPE